MVEYPEFNEEFRGSPIADALDAARQLLALAEAEAATLRTEAEAHARRRSQEAELLVAKARRVLEAAEARAAVIVSTARSSVAAEIVLDVRSEADVLAVGPRPARRATPRATRFDSLLATAIANAVDDAFPTTAPPG